MTSRCSHHASQRWKATQTTTKTSQDPITSTTVPIADQPWSIICEAQTSGGSSLTLSVWPTPVSCAWTGAGPRWNQAVVAPVMHQFPKFLSARARKLPRTAQAFKGWRNLTPSNTNKAQPLDLADTDVPPIRPFFQSGSGNVLSHERASQSAESDQHKIEDRAVRHTRHPGYRAKPLPQKACACVDKGRHKRHSVTLPLLPVWTKRWKQSRTFGVARRVTPYWTPHSTQSIHRARKSWTLKEVRQRGAPKDNVIISSNQQNRQSSNPTTSARLSSTPSIVSGHVSLGAREQDHTQANVLAIHHRRCLFPQFCVLSNTTVWSACFFCFRFCFGTEKEAMVAIRAWSLACLHPVVCLPLSPTHQ